MHSIDIGSLDLNLLHALHVLLEEANVTRASRRLGRTQSATSHSLARLRESLGDPLLVRTGRGMVRTTRAEALRPQVEEVLRSIEALLRPPAPFDAATTTRTFRVACPDGLAALLPDLFGRLRAEAPGIRLELLRPVGDDPAEELDRTRADLALAPAPEEPGGLRGRRLGTVAWAVVGRADHPFFLGPRDLSAWLASPHVILRTANARASLVDEALTTLGRTREVGLIVPHMLLALHALPGSDLLFCTPAPLVRPFVERLGLALCAPPVPLPAVPVMSLWLPTVHGDVGHRWFRDRLGRIVGEGLGA